MKYYFTFGNSEQFPFQNAYLTIDATTEAAAIQEFRSHFPDIHSNTINCSFVYNQGEWDAVKNKSRLFGPVLEFKAPQSKFSVTMEWDKTENSYRFTASVLPVMLRSDEFIPLVEYQTTHSNYAKQYFDTQAEAQREAEFLNSFDFTVERSRKENPRLGDVKVYADGELLAEFSDTISKDGTIGEAIDGYRSERPDSNFVRMAIWTPFTKDFERFRSRLEAIQEQEKDR